METQSPCNNLWGGQKGCDCRDIWICFVFYLNVLNNRLTCEKKTLMGESKWECIGIYKNERAIDSFCEGRVETSGQDVVCPEIGDKPSLYFN